MPPRHQAGTSPALHESACSTSCSSLQHRKHMGPPEPARHRPAGGCLQHGMGFPLASRMRQAVLCKGLRMAACGGGVALQVGPTAIVATVVKLKTVTFLEVRAQCARAVGRPPVAPVVLQVSRPSSSRQAGQLVAGWQHRPPVKQLAAAPTTQLQGLGSTAKHLCLQSAQ